MSYPGYQYTPYIGQATNDQSVRSHQRLNSTSSSQNHQQTPVQQYAQQPAYGWSQQNQPTQGNGDSQTYGTTRWKAERDEPHNYSQRSQTSYAAANPITSNNYHVSAPEPQISPPALDSLAYVSGLEAAGLNSRGTQQSASVSSNYNMGSSRQQTPDRGNSPYGQNPTSTNESYLPNRPPSAASRASQQQGQKSPHQSQKLAASAIGALQDTLDGYNTQSSLQYSTYGPSSGNTATASNTRKAMQSPSVMYSNTNQNSQPQASGTRPRLSTPVGRGAQQSSTSRWNPPQPSHSRVPSSQGSGQNQYSTITAAPSNTISSPARGTGLSHTGENQHPTYQGSQSQQQSTGGQYVNSSRPLPNSGQSHYGDSQNLPNRQPQADETQLQRKYTTSYQPEISPTQNSMPSFIDPSQVYNPYQQEYEKRKAADQAEAERQRLLDAEQREQEAQREASAAVELETAKEKKGKQPRSRKSAKSKIEDPRRSQGSVDPAFQAATILTSGITVDGGDTNDDDLEMKMMLETMKRLKSKDPSKFQQLVGNLTKESQPTESTTQPSTQVAPAAMSHSPAGDPPSKSGSRRESLRAFQYIPPDDNPEKLPDLGKFPVQRRKRYRTHKKDNSHDSPIPDGYVRIECTDPVRPAVHSSPYAPAYPAPTQTHAGQTSPNQGQSAPESGSGFKFPTPANLRFQVPLGSVHTSAAPPATSAFQPGPSSRSAQQTSHAPASANAPTRPPPTVWPTAKRKALAEAAVRTLLLNPLNRDKGLGPDLILTLLELNPSYPELCEKLESRGITLHRGNFAKSLLQSVPDLASSSSQQAGTGANAVVSPTAQALKLQPTAAAQEGAQAVLQLNTSVAADSKTNTTSSPAIIKPESGQSTWKPTMVPGVTGSSSSTQRRRSKAQTPSIQSTPAGPKEAMARKRDFSEIVDLTQSIDDDEDNDEDDYPPAKEPRLDPNLDPRLFQPPPFPPRPAAFTAPASLPLKFPLAVNGSRDQERRKEEIARRSAVRANINLVKPVIKANALRKSMYNPLTIARDILLASGRHPTEDPLNAHLARLTTRLPQIGFDADLSTLRWDLIDPGGPEVVADESTKIPTNQRFNASGYAKELTATQAQLVRLAHKQRSKRTETQQSALRNVTNLESDRETASPDFEITAPPVSSPHTKQTPSNTMPPTSFDRDTTESSSGPKRRGRPPKSFNSAPNSEPSPFPKRRGRPPGSKTKGTSLRELVGEGPRRPKGIPRQRSPLPQRPSYNIYDCRWLGCDAKLHNLDTLKRHFVKVHHHEDDHGCLWAGCGTDEEVYDKPSNSYNTVHKPLEFPERGAWQNHVLSQHLDPLGWTLGAGPSVRTNDDSSVPSYLLDSSGHLVTPIIDPNSSRPLDTMHLVKPTLDRDSIIDRKGVITFNKAHGKHTPAEKAKEFLRAIEAKKTAIGTLIDRGGSTMVNRDNRHILDVSGEVKVIVHEDDWLFEGRDREDEMETQESDDF